MTERLSFHFSLSCTGEGNGSPLQCSCLENPRGGGAWWASVYGVAQSWTRLKRLSSSCSILLIGFPGGTSVKNLPSNAGDIRDGDLIPSLGRSPGGGHGNPHPAFMPGEFHGQKSLAGHSSWGCKELTRLK